MSDTGIDLTQENQDLKNQLTQNVNYIKQLHAQIEVSTQMFNENMNAIIQLRIQNVLLSKQVNEFQGQAAIPT